VSLRRPMRNTATESAWQYCHRLASGHAHPLVSIRGSDENSVTVAPSDGVTWHGRSRDSSRKFGSRPHPPSPLRANALNTSASWGGSAEGLDGARARRSTTGRSGDEAVAVARGETMAILPSVLLGSIAHRAPEGHCHPSSTKSRRLSRPERAHRARSQFCATRCLPKLKCLSSLTSSNPARW